MGGEMGNMKQKQYKFMKHSGAVKRIKLKYMYIITWKYHQDKPLIFLKAEKNARYSFMPFMKNK